MREISAEPPITIKEEILKSVESFQKKWGILPILDLLLVSHLPILDSKTIGDWEHHFAATEHCLIPPAVVAGNPFTLFAFNMISTAGDVTRNSRLSFNVDLSYPRDVLLSLIDIELRKALETVNLEDKSVCLSDKRQRRRHDKLTFQLNVYDLAMQGLGMWEIKRELKKPVKTIVSAYNAAYRLVRNTKKPTFPRHSRAEFKDAWRFRPLTERRYKAVGEGRCGDLDITLVPTVRMGSSYKR